MEIHTRHAYDDVTLLASSDPEVSSWKLEVRETSGWNEVQPKLMDSRLNWSTPNVVLCEELRSGGAETFDRLFPDAPVSIDTASIEVMWDISGRVGGGVDRQFRFTDPTGAVHEFAYSWALRGHVFG